MALLHSRHLVDTLAFVANFGEECPENSLKRGSKRPFLDTKSAIERPRRLDLAQSLLHVMRICLRVILSYFDARSKTECPQKDFWIACLLLLLLLKCVSHAWTLSRVVKPSSVTIFLHFGTGLGLSVPFSSQSNSNKAVPHL